MNDAVLDLINGHLAGRWDLLDDQAVWWAKDGIFLLAAVAGAFGLWELRRSPRRAVLIAASVVAGAIAAGILLLIAAGSITEARPFVTDHDTIQLLKHSQDNSFPSDHATLAGVIAVAASLAWRRWAALFLAIGIIIGLSRVISGIHYPGDVVAGWAIGGGSAFAAWWACRRFAPAVLTAELEPASA
jgi:membrane-associated phospholipid phosphatase